MQVGNHTSFLTTPATIKGARDERWAVAREDGEKLTIVTALRYPSTIPLLVNGTEYNQTASRK
jgi:hypothetical protein